MIFVDTGAWFAMAVPSDQDHALVVPYFASHAAMLFTTDYVGDDC